MSGLSWGRDRDRCPECGGSGYVVVVRGLRQLNSGLGGTWIENEEEEECPVCEGSGYAPDLADEDEPP